MHLIETVCSEKCAQLGFAEVQVDVKAIKFLRLFAGGKERWMGGERVRGRNR